MDDHNKKAAGSSTKNEPAYLLIGRLQKSHGIKGEIAMRVHTQFPERIRAGKSVYVGDEKGEMIVASIRWKANLLPRNLPTMRSLPKPATFQNSLKDNITITS